MVHLGMKPFQCQFCEFKTAHSRALKRHMNIHAGETSARDLYDFSLINLGAEKVLNTGEGKDGELSALSLGNIPLEIPF